MAMTDASTLIQASRNLAVRPPIKTKSIAQFDASTIANHARQSRIAIHPRFRILVKNFLEHKRQHGSKHEKKLYHEDFTWRHNISRLVEKRPLVFMGSTDYTMLPDGTKLPRNPPEEWERNGTEQQDLKSYLTLDAYLSYDEIMLSSLIAVSGLSFFISDGNRYNRGRVGVEGSCETSGVIIGLVGPRFELEDRMDSVYVLPKASNPRQDLCLSRIFESFFGKQKAESQFDVEMYKARIRVTADMLLLEANERAKDAPKKAWTYVVGLGLGVLRYNSGQADHYIDAFASPLSDLTRPTIGTLEFAYIAVDSARQQNMFAIGQQRCIDVVFSKRAPAAKLEN